MDSIPIVDRSAWGDLPHSCKFCKRLTLDLGDPLAIHEPHKSHETYENSQGLRSNLWNFIKEVLNPRDNYQAESGPDFDTIQRFKYKAANKSESYGIIFNCTLKDISRASRSNCLFAHFILPQLISRKFTDLDAFQDHTLLALFTFDTVVFGFGLPDNLTELLSGLNFSKSLSRRRYQMLTSVDNAAAMDIPTRPVNIHPASPESLELSKTWMQTCLDTHRGCPKPDRKFMPTRVLEIVRARGHTFLHLRETSGREWEPYAALSYCWGTEQHLTTTSENLHRHLTRINMKDLPATMKDAILVAENLGIRNVWIDALCILQDDVSDKAFEIAQMALIYNQATITIAATRAGGVQEGFLGDRKPYEHDIHLNDFVAACEIPYRSRTGAMGSVVLVHDRESPTQPLDTRAWAFQERLLSPRILEYGSLQTRWTCQGIAGRDSMTDGFKDTSPSRKEATRDSLAYDIQALTKSAGGDSSAPINKQDVTKLWYQVINKYTRRNLTLSTDRLPAIAGIAQLFGRFLDDQYRAGLWMSNLGTELLWHVDNATASPHRKPTEYQGPSWSWVAINEPIRFFEEVQMDPDFEVLDCQTTLQTDNPRLSFVTSKYGPVEFGSLRARGHVVEAERSIINKFRVKKQDGEYRLLYATQMRLDGPDIFEPGEAFRRPEVYLLRLSISQVRGLILRRNSGSGFSRIGVFECSPDFVRIALTDQDRSDEFQKDLACFESAELYTVRIV